MAPKFTKRHYQAIANAIRETVDPMLKDKYSMSHRIGIAMAVNIALSMGKMFMLDNDKFYAEKFMKACGLDQEE